VVAAWSCRLPWLFFLRKKLGDKVHFWPFDGWNVPAGKSGIVEVYPSLWSKSLPPVERTQDQQVDLTPSQYTSADKVRMGRITCVGKNSLRAMLIQASWTLIRKDGVMREKYDRLKSRSGGNELLLPLPELF
jgi:hypothetical protein